MFNTKDSASLMVVAFLAILVVGISIYYILKKVKAKKEDKQSYIEPAVKKEDNTEKIKVEKIEPKIELDVENEDEITDELISVFMAAISAIRSNNSRPFVIKKVKQRKRRSSWNIAGIKDNLSPF